ncbi:MAG: acyl-CoA dehydrogenase family protein [Thermoleophilaceae bacterium]|nr:acyl-CoA dehydrogenase family protein [Thermoleophilaceae bacterium]
MDLRDTPGEAKLREEIRGWLEANYEPGISQSDWYKVLAESGWAAPLWPEQYGGRGASASEAIIFNQERQKIGAEPPPTGIGVPMAGPTIIAHGTEEQKERFLGPMLRGEEVWCQLFSEPGAGSDLAAIQTRAELKGDTWHVSGQKVWTTHAQLARWGILMARHDPSLPKHAGITYFIMDMQAEGVEIVPLKEMTGEAVFNEVFMDDVEIPDDLRVGALGEGWKVSMTTLANERMALGLGGLGGSDEDAEIKLEEADAESSLETMGKFIRRGPRALIELAERAGAINDPLIRDELARVYTMYEVNRFTGYRITTALMKGRGPGVEASTGKLSYNLLVRAVADLMIRIAGVGALGAPDDDKLLKVAERLNLVVPATSIYGGTDQIQRNIISERVLGMPKEPRTDAEQPFSEIKKGG